MVSELLALKIENVTLKLAQLETIRGELVRQQAELIEQARAEVGAPPEHLYHMQTRAFQAVRSEE